MAFKYRDYVAHAITFFAEGKDGRNTWEDWRIVPTSRPTVATPRPKYNFVQIPGSSFVADLTETIAGEVTYEPREGSFEFAEGSATMLGRGENGGDACVVGSHAFVKPRRGIEAKNAAVNGIIPFVVKGFHARQEPEPS